MIGKSIKNLKSEALLYHSHPTAGKYDLVPTKPLTSIRELNFASCENKNSCMRIFKHPRLVYKYTNKGKVIAIISNGSDVSGLHGLGPLAAKPLMEGKAALYKRLAGLEAVDICIDAETGDDIVNCVKYLAPSFSAINLAGIKAPDCYYAEEKLQELMNIPVYDDD
jgi:malate dehydrogenase (oxaloacetate-decarboxylating)(NADP+)